MIKFKKVVLFLKPWLFAVIFVVFILFQVAGYTDFSEDFFGLFHIGIGQLGLLLRYSLAFLLSGLVTFIYLHYYKKLMGKNKNDYIKKVKSVVIFVTFFIGGFILYKDIYLSDIMQNAFLWQKFEYMSLLGSTFLIYWCEKLTDK
ncbi:hypothetical protein K1Y25_08335 [Mammaliicoccus sciuri]|uniref:hypothetical protein n=1 Tax=Mammaliicoccus TaxID=2803850 RepID=UPI0007D98B46|nr:MULTISPECIES: hypothetical protein [Mammaliicoccus]MCD8809253.1 hypothetical protein [Mammaliicoccus sciuri]OAO24864.1 hypothetical protein AXY34_02790 [Mammaliicoccus lentus]